MPHLAVVVPGASSIQGLGYYGAQRYGISPGGAMDRLALAEANALAGQPAGAAAIEIGPLPARFRVGVGAVRLVFSGAAREVTVDGTPVAMGRTVLIGAGADIVVRGAAGGQFSYCACEGGLLPGGQDIAAPARTRPPSSDPRTWVLQAGDNIPMKAASAGPERQLRLHAHAKGPIRVVLGPQLEYFSETALSGFLAATWTVSHASNRMAFVLEGARVPLVKGHNIVSDGTVSGNIQIAGNGQPIVILSDRGTVGGYPKIATIISADLGRFAQTPQGGQVTFNSVSVLEARVVAQEFALRLANVKPRVEIAGASLPSTSTLLASNLAGDACNPLDAHVEERSRERTEARGLVGGAMP